MKLVHCLYNFHSKSHKLHSSSYPIGCRVSKWCLQTGSGLANCWHGLAPHYASKDHWSEANLMIIFCPISAGNWLVSIIGPGGHELAVLTNQRPLFRAQRPIRGENKVAASDHHQIWQINREYKSWHSDPGRWSVQFIFTPGQVFMRKIQSRIRCWLDRERLLVMILNHIGFQMI